MSDNESTPRINLGQISADKPAELDARQIITPVAATTEPLEDTQRMFQSKQLKKPTVELIKAQNSFVIE